MAIFREPLSTKNFTQVPNHWLRDPRLTAKAKGILAYIASHAAGYELTVVQIIAEMKDGESAVKAALRELEAAGYLRRRQRRDPGGRLSGTDYWIVENPDGDATVGRFSTSGKSASGETTSGSPASGGSGTKNNNPKNTTTQNTNGTDQTCPASGRSAPSDGGREDNFVADDSTTDEGGSWRAEDRDLFRSYIGPQVRSLGVNQWHAGVFNTDDVYTALRQKGTRPMQWPGRYLSKLEEDQPDDGIANWLDDQGFVPV